MSVPLSPSPDRLKDPVKISIPRYVLRGQGKDEHYEFEVKVCFRELGFCSAVVAALGPEASNINDIIIDIASLALYWS